MKDVTVAQKKRGDYRCVNSMQYRIPYRSTGVLERTVGHGLGTSRKLTSLVSRASSRSKSLCKTGFATGIIASRVVIRFDRFIAITGLYRAVSDVATTSGSQSYQRLRDLTGQASLRHDGSLHPDKLPNRPEHHIDNVAEP
jgi:hypothetical protein